MPDFNKGLIYKICCLDPEVKGVYVGSTTNLTERRRSHKKACISENDKSYNYPVYQHIREHGGWANWEVVPVEECPCETKHELGIRERHWLETLGATLNKAVPTRTRAEYNAVHKEEIREYNAQHYREEIAAKGSAKVTCQFCGSVVRKGGLVRHQKTKKCLAAQNA